MHDIFVALLVTTAREHGSKMLLLDCRYSPAGPAVFMPDVRVADNNTVLKIAFNEKLMRGVIYHITL